MIVQDHKAERGAIRVLERERDAFAEALNGYAEVFYAHRDGELTDAEALKAYNAHTRFLGTDEALP